MEHDPVTGTTTYDGPDEVALFAITVVAHGAALYLNTGIKPNRAYTPAAMRDTLNRATGSKARNLKAALAAYADALEAAGHPTKSETVLRALGREAGSSTQP